MFLAWSLASQQCLPITPQVSIFWLKVMTAGEYAAGVASH